jgi:anti-sigma factor RsiW
MTDGNASRNERDDDVWLLDAALDGELDAARSLALERRLDADPALRAQWDARRALRAAVRAEATYHRAPQGLHERLRAAMDTAAPAPDVEQAGAAALPESPRPAISGARSARPAPRRSRAAFDIGALRPWAWLSSGALAGAAAAVLVMALVPRPGGGAGPAVRAAVASRDSMAAEAVSAHTRALLVGETVEVASSDRHTVRPWLAARLNFVPPIVDFVDKGFPLAGARRDVIGGETSAALVYRHGAHVVSVFVRPAAVASAGSGSAVRGADTTPTLEVVRGFNVVQMRAAGMDYTLVSDMSADEMGELARLLLHAAG